MKAEEFIEVLEAKELLSESMGQKLRKKVTSSGKTLTAKSLARFLIEKGHLSKQDAMEALAAGGEIAPPEPSGVGESSDPSGVDLPMDQLQDLSSSAEWSIDESGGFGEPAVADAAAAGGGKKKKKKKGGKTGNEWDSPLLLIGGGALVLMLIVGPLIAYIMFAENADNVLASARQAMQEGSYANAIVNYERFVEDYPGNTEHSTARVELAMARIRRTLESGNVTLAFDVAQEELRAIGDEQAFNVAEEDLSDLLPRIARGLADRAEASEDLEQTNELFEQASTALGMANNTKYIPKSRRDNAELEGIRETLDRIERRQQSLADLEATLADIDKAIANGDTAAAYAAQESLVEKHPTLLENQQLAEALQKISAAEQQSIRFVEEPIEDSTTEPASAVSATLVMANRRKRGNAPVEGIFCSQADGVVYGIDASTGSVVWRRYVGPAIGQTFPKTVDNDLLLVEWRAPDGEQPQQALVRVEAGSGKLSWRLELDDELAAPVVAGNVILLAGASGKLHVVDADSGTRVGYVAFAQPLRSPPAVNEQAGVAYLAGDHSSIYSISMKDFSCIGVYYAKHPRESVVAPPAVVLDKVAFVQNDGAETCLLRLCALNDQGAIEQPLVERRLTGRVVRQPLVDGRRLVVLTDRGQIGVYEVSVGPDGDPLNLLATRAARSSQPFVRYGNISDSHIWYTENALAKYAVAPTGNRLTVQPLANDYNRSQFVAPLEIREGVLFQTRARHGRTGFTVTACSTEDGSPYWETDLGAPPAGSPLASSSPVALLEADANGQVYRFDPEAIRSRVQNEALPMPEAEQGGSKLVYQHATLLEGGGAVFTSDGEETALLYTPGGDQPLKKVQLPGPLACKPTALGNGWVAPLTVGQVFLLDSQTGDPLAAPFQPALESGSKVSWRPAEAAGEGQCLLTDGVSRVYLLELRQDGTPALVSVAEADIGNSPLSTSVVAAERLAFAGTDTGRVATFQLPGLDAGEQIDVGGSIIWGPHVVGNHVVVRTSNGQLVAIDSQGGLAWQTAAPVADFTGPPLAVGDSLLVASQSGVIVRIDLDSGKEAGRVDTRQPLAAGPVRLNNRLVVAARDSALLVVETP